MDSEFVILGGGVAGLCAAIRLLELGIYPLVIEAGEYPAHKVCGEFFSPDSMSLLKKWDIHPMEIREAHFHTPSESLKYKFPTPAGSLSHLTFDPQLVSRASGAIFLTKTKVAKLHSHTPHHILELECGRLIHTPNLIIATGRIPQNDVLKAPQLNQPVYTGIKAHFEGDIPKGILEMFYFNGAYTGVSPVEDGKFNVACLCKHEKFKEWKSPKEFMEHLRSENKLFDSSLKRGKCLFQEWMSVSAPEFGEKETPQWPHTYFIGDAAGSIPPATGNGLTLAIKGGIMAAEYGLTRDYEGFRKNWSKTLASPIFWGKTLNRATMNPWMSSHLIKLGRKFPGIIDFIFHKTR